VSEPDLRSSDEAVEYFKQLRSILLYLGINDGDMEEGSLRCDANVSLRPLGAAELGVKTELKNMNSFRFLERGVAAELERQAELLDGGEAVAQETLHYDPRTGSLTPLRSKEYAHDYRYFPEPDLVALVPTERMLAEAREALPELPAQRRHRYEDELGLDSEAAGRLAFDAELGSFFERTLAAADGVEPRVVANWVGGELVARLREAGGDDADPAASRVTPEALASLAAMVQAKEIATGAARQVLAVLVSEGGRPAEIVAREGLEQIDDQGRLAELVRQAIEADPAAAARVREGNPKAIGPLVGFVMRETKGRADGGEVARLNHEQLGDG
jgi:aspartyl-tRNA(Asn)/glutamyl-tRNA(Gln) amidotransferase subunit B